MTVQRGGWLLGLAIVTAFSGCHRGPESSELPPTRRDRDLASAPEFSVGEVLLPAGEVVLRSQEEGVPGPDGPIISEDAKTVVVASVRMDQDEVSVERFREYCLETGSELPVQPNWSSDRHPVVNVTWDEAVAFARWSGKRLPTVAEWYLAAERAGSSPFRRPPPEFFSLLPSADRSEIQDVFRPTPADVDLTPRGLSDCRNLLWNVQEWTSDACTPTPKQPHVVGHPNEELVPTRVVVGWFRNDFGGKLVPRWDWRMSVQATTRARDVGFRCCVDQP